MPSFLDTILNRQTANQHNAQQELASNYNAAHVLNLSPKGIQFAVPDNRVSSSMARHNAQQILGYTPERMKVQGGNVIPFAKDEGQQMFEQLTKAGIKRGSSLFELQKFLQQQQGTQTNRAPAVASGADNNPLLPIDNNKGTVGVASGKGGGGVSSGDGYLKDQNRSNMSEGYEAGYQSPQGGLMSNFQPLNAVTQISEEFSRLLHSSLFSNQ